MGVFRSFDSLCRLVGDLSDRSDTSRASEIVFVVVSAGASGRGELRPVSHSLASDRMVEFRTS